MESLRGKARKRRSKRRPFYRLYKCFICFGYCFIAFGYCFVGLAGAALPLAGASSISTDDTSSSPLATVPSASVGASLSLAGASSPLAIVSSVSVGASINVTRMRTFLPDAVVQDTEDEGSEFDDLYDDEFTISARRRPLRIANENVERKYSPNTKVKLNYQEDRAKEDEQLSEINIIGSDSEHEFDDLYDASEDERVRVHWRTKRIYEKKHKILGNRLGAHKNDPSGSDTKLRKAQIIAIHILKEHSQDEL
ncbi:uncharacterized protein N7483_005428 [Penicillium malachiteum]|uniref:uncharacterized protein n=1 Tax=Penicillium malachiteum TaxID=1324776 RepID=UPI00254725FA|nr:uncharacterized protein N7483_005428 [Penicillium malachiteum]KAJ5730920.1 hypothetical protein N7483_005428 [Penicillium malachiteum]